MQTYTGSLELYFFAQYTADNGRMGSRSFELSQQYLMTDCGNFFTRSLKTSTSVCENAAS